MPDVQIEIIVEGKGAITINQKVELDPKRLQKLTAHCVELLNGTSKSQRFGFSAGSDFHDEVAGD